MSRTSPGVHRTAAIINFLSDHPGQSFALTDFVRALQLSRATCHSLLTSLVDVGYLYRAKDKSYMLGPTLVRIGKAAEQSFSPLLVAQPEMRALADRYEAICTAAFLEGHEIHIRDRASSIGAVANSVPVGTRLPLRVPLAGVYLAPLEDAAITRWLDNAQPQPGEEQRKLQWENIQFIRQHGFNVFLTSRQAPDPGSARAVFEGSGSDFGVEPITSLDDFDGQRVSTVIAPVLGKGGKVEFAIGLMGLNRVMSREELLEAGDDVRGACNRVGSYIER